MNIEREYYENDAFWNDSSLRENDSVRVNALAKMVPGDVKTVVELGCGNGIFVNALGQGDRRYARLVGLDRSVAALRYVNVPRLCASVDAIPLADESFDLVALLEVIEHLPARTYDAALAEASRLARRYVVISVPNEQDLESALIECPSCRSRFNPDYHMRSFDESSMRRLLDRFGFRCVVSSRLGTYMRYRGVDWMRSRNRDIAGNPFAVAIPCPICGTVLPAGAPAAKRNGTPPSSSWSIRSAVKRVWPKAEGHTWLAALYERANA